MKLFHISDQHFEKDKLDKCNASADFIIGKANELRPDIIVSAGDIFNRVQTLNSKSAVTAAKRFVMSLAEAAPVVMVKGNEAHDSAGCLEVFRNLSTKHPIYVTESCQTIMFEADAGGMFFPIGQTLRNVEREKATAILHLMSYPEKAWFLRS